MTVDQEQDHRPTDNDAYSHRLIWANWARGGEYGLSQEAASVFWYLHSYGIWEPGQKGWLGAPGYADMRLTMNSYIQRATSLDEDSVRRGLDELEEKHFIRRTPRFWNNGMQSNDAIEFAVPHEWCPACATRKSGEHECKPRECDCFDLIR